MGMTDTEARSRLTIKKIGWAVARAALLLTALLASAPAHAGEVDDALDRIEAAVDDAVCIVNIGPGERRRRRSLGLVSLLAGSALVIGVWALGLMIYTVAIKVTINVIGTGRRHTSFLPPEA